MSTYTIRSRSYVFQSSAKNKHTTWEKVSVDRPLFKLEKVSRSIHWPSALFRFFESCFRSPHFATNGCTFEVCPMRLCCCLNHKNAFTSKSMCFAPWASFVLQLKMRAFGSTAFLFPITILTVNGLESELYRDVSLLPFRISVHWFEVSSFSFIDNSLLFLPAMVPSITKWRGCRSPQNE